MTITEPAHASSPAASFEVRAISPAVVSQLRVTDDAGRPPRMVTDSEGGSPLRCCLRQSEPGEQIALVSYAPLRRWARETGADPGPYDEIGPVFIHPGPCAGQQEDGFPSAYVGSRRVFRAYTANGNILGGRLAEPEEVRDLEAAAVLLAEIFGDPRVALVHARAVDFGCFTFEIRRGGHQQPGAVAIGRPAPS
jgi:Protein of unknown function (DUF1203)